VAAVGLAAALVAAVGLLYLRPWQAFAPRPAPPPAPTPIAATAPIQQVRFLSSDLGWVVTGDATEGASLFRTTDGGRRWRRQLEGVGAQAWRISFFDARHGVVTGTDNRGEPALWKTVDGGQRWTSGTIPCDIRGLAFFLDLDHGWCLTPTDPSTGTALFPLPDHQDVALYRTADGGGHWARLLATDPAHPVSGGLGDDGQKAWIWFRDARNGWIGQRTPGGHAVVYATTDGGDAWARQELPPPAAGWGSIAGTWDEGPAAVAGGSVPALVVSEIIAGPRGGSISLTSQNVYTWQPPAWIGPVLIPGGGGVLVAGPARWLVANGNSLLETSDGGENWVPLGMPPPGWLMSSIAMLDRGTGWAVVLHPGLSPTRPAFGLARTTDGGLHWALISLPA
jgi:photosystem II stability/assembly factor-like uncharacterized protein